MLKINQKNSVANLRPASASLIILAKFLRNFAVIGYVIKTNLGFENAEITRF